MDIQHTPAPWEAVAPSIDPQGASRAWEVFAKTDGVPIPVCQMFRSGDKNHEANARLIAAAPQLLGALREIVSQIDQGDPGKVFARDACIARARAAIALATPAKVKS